MEKLNFLTAGLPLASGNKGYEAGLNILKELDLDGLEAEFVHGVRMSPENRKTVLSFAKENNMLITCHGPFYINLNSDAQEKIDASIVRILDTARTGKDIGAYSITFHAAFYMKKNPEEVYKIVYDSMEKISEILEQEENNIWIRPETTGKGSQWGTLEEITELSKHFKNVLPCVDFSHIHARNKGKFNTYDEFSKMLEFMGNELGNDIFDNFHAHLAGIEYTDKGEKKHLIFEDSDMNYKDLLKVFKKFNVKGALVCESPNIETDAKLLKDYYLSL
ncbi:MAG: TIM barrel protein [Candidatus Gastranaerophilales bacterium]|nr:TIM barrel protein [Candidatus Gastranaerophilales bacterium]